jgi:glycosyltransferase involved in cell wall biosynthesis
MADTEFPAMTDDHSKPPQRPLISVVTASMNNRLTIADNLQSVRSQTFKSLEHIVVDGGSIDGSVDILKSYEQSYALHWVSEPDGGITDAMNKGIGRSRGTYIIVIHADDALIAPDVLQSVSDYLRGERCDIYSFAIRFCHPYRGIIQVASVRFPGWYRFRNTIRHQGCFIHRRLYVKLSGYRPDYKISADYDFFYRAFQARASIRYFNQPVSVMGGMGVSSDPGFLVQRLREEQRIQRSNESSSAWRVAQRWFHALYVPYKMRVLNRRFMQTRP